MLIKIQFRNEFIYILYFMVINFPIYLFKKIYNIKNKYLNLLTSIANIFQITFFFIESFESKRENYIQRLTRIKGRNTAFMFSTIHQEEHLSKLKMILLSCSIILSLIYYYIPIGKLDDFENHIYLLLFLFLINFFFFKKKIFSHHLLSIIMIIFLFIYFIYLNYNKYQLVNFLLYLVKFYSFAFSYLLIKYLNTTYYLNIYFIAFFLGIFQLIEIIILNFSKNNYNLDLKEIGILIFFSLFIVYILKNFLYFQIIVRLSPIHVFLGDYITYLLFQMFDPYFNGSIINILNVILIIISIITSLIYLEILQLNFCGLSDNIEKNIIKRGLSEMQFLDKTISVSDTSSIINQKLRISDIDNAL